MARNSRFSLLIQRSQHGFQYNRFPCWVGASPGNLGTQDMDGKILASAGFTGEVVVVGVCP